VTTSEYPLLYVFCLRFDLSDVRPLQFDSLQVFPLPRLPCHSSRLSIFLFVPPLGFPTQAPLTHPFPHVNTMCIPSDTQHSPTLLFCAPAAAVPAHFLPEVLSHTAREMRRGDGRSRLPSGRCTSCRWDDCVESQHGASGFED
jgi:hypothetical protein